MRSLDLEETLIALTFTAASKPVAELASDPRFVTNKLFQSKRSFP